MLFRSHSLVFQWRFHAPPALPAGRLGEHCSCLADNDLWSAAHLHAHRRAAGERKLRTKERKTATQRSSADLMSAHFSSLCSSLSLSVAYSPCDPPPSPAPGLSPATCCLSFSLVSLPPCIHLPLCIRGERASERERESGPRGTILAPLSSTVEMNTRQNGT